MDEKILKKTNYSRRA